MIQSISRSGELWLRQRNVEMACCPLMSFDDVCAGEHRVIAIGNDMVAAEIYVDTDVADSVGEIADLMQLTYLGKFLAMQRGMEAVSDVTY